LLYGTDNEFFVGFQFTLIIVVAFFILVAVDFKKQHLPGLLGTGINEDTPA
jgi:hypothetical protein